MFSPHRTGKTDGDKAGKTIKAKKKKKTVAIRQLKKGRSFFKDGSFFQFLHLYPCLSFFFFLFFEIRAQ